ncbi:MAG: aminoglycoside phosphotransferase family protein [Chloroflexota bacterium]
MKSAETFSKLENIIIPNHLVVACQNDPASMAWLNQLPNTIKQLQEEWSLRLAAPLTVDASCSWVAPCLRADNTPAILKLGMPHMEAEHEIDGLLFWQGDPTVLLLEADRERNAMLLERCVPGTSLGTRPASEQDQVIATILKRMWRRPPTAPFRPLTQMIAEWNRESREQLAHWPDPELAREGVQLRTELAANATESVMLATDLHAGNVLRAEREPWLAIDPKPFYGDPAYDATQHLLNCQQRLLADPQGVICGFADLLEVDCQRVQQWLFARLAAEFGGTLQTLAREVL